MEGKIKLGKIKVTCQVDSYDDPAKTSINVDNH
jgi:hypothetical protein